MAYNTRSRDPLLDSNMQAAIERRGKELIGIVLLGLGVAAMAMILSYTPDDPNWMVSTDAAVQNWLGRPGASIAAPLFMVVGWGALGFGAIFLAWGLRFLLHIGEERAVSRLIFAPIAVGVLSVYAATLVPGADWRATHSFGLGGLFGDTAMGALLTLLPIGSHLAVKLTGLCMGLVTLVLAFFVMGFTRAELSRILRLFVLGIVMGYSAILSVLGKGARGASDAARMRAQMRAQRRAEAEAEAQAGAFAAEAAAAPRVSTAPSVAINRSIPAAPARYDDAYSAQDEMPPLAAPAPNAVPPAPAALRATQEPRVEPQPERGGLLSRMPSLIRRAEPIADEMPDPELVETYPPDFEDDEISDDRIRARIADAVRSRTRRGQPEPEAPVDDPTKPLTRGRGRGPQPLIFKAAPPVAAAPTVAQAMSAGQDEIALPPEPPLSRHVPAAAGLKPEPPLRAQAPGARRAEPEQMVAPGFEGAREDEAAFTEVLEEDYGDYIESNVTPYQPRRAVGPVVAPSPAPTPKPAPMPEGMAEQDDFGGSDDHDDVDAYDDAHDSLDDAGHDTGPRVIPRAAPIPVAEPKKVVQNPTRKAPQPSKRARAEAQPSLSFDEQEQKYELPPLSLLMSPDTIQRHHLSDEALEENARMLENVLDDYGVKGEIVSVRPGPVVTM